jgi:hypothetical protein
MWVMQFWPFTQWRIFLTYASIEISTHQIVKDISKYVGIANLVGVHMLKDFGRHARITKKMCPSFNSFLPWNIR